MIVVFSRGKAKQGACNRLSRKCVRDRHLIVLTGPFKKAGRSHERKIIAPFRVN